MSGPDLGGGGGGGGGSFGVPSGLIFEAKVHFCEPRALNNYVWSAYEEHIILISLFLIKPIPSLCFHRHDPPVLF